MAKFRINYSKVKRQANDIKELSNDLGDEITRLKKHLQDVAKDWKGPASDEYQNQLQKLILNMMNTKKKMLSLSTTIKNVAYNIQQEDEALAEKAKKSSSLAGGGSSGGGGFR